MSDSKKITLLNSYALIKASWLEGDYISSFVPMMVSLIGKKAYDIIDPESLSADFEKEYGFSIPHHPTIKLLSCLQKNGYISYIDDRKSWKPNEEKISEIQITDKCSELHEKMRQLIQKIICFSKDTFEKDLKEDVATEMLFSFIQTYSSSILNDHSVAASNSFESRNTIGCFIDYISKNDITTFSTLKQITIGKLLTDALTLTEDKDDKHDFGNVTIYIDTRIFLYLLGFYGAYRQQATENLLKKLSTYGANLKLFKHTDNEISFTLRNCEAWIESSNYDPELASSALRYLKSCGKDRKYVQGLIVSVPQKLDEFGIEIEDGSLIGDDHKFQIDTTDLKNQITSCYVNNKIEISERVKETIGYDVDSIQAIYYKRKDEVSYSINETAAFLLTSNRNLVFASKKFHEKNYNAKTIQSCISDIFVGTFIWAHSGIKCCEEMIELKLIADCSIAMEPPQCAIAKYCKRINEMYKQGKITETEVVALKCYGLQTQSAQTLFMGENDYEYKDLHEIMDEIKQQAIAHEKEKFDADRASFENIIQELRTENGINKADFEKYRDMAVEYAKRDSDAKAKEEQLLENCSEKAEKKLKYLPIVLNASFNVLIQIVLFCLSIKWLCLILRIAIPLFSLFVGLSIQCNWLHMNDKIKFYLIFRYKKQYQKDLIKQDVKAYTSK